MIEDFSFKALIKRGWQRWDSPNKEGFGLLLCPLEDFDNVPDGIIFDCIDGQRQYVIGLDEIDMDTRGGMLAFGVRQAAGRLVGERPAVTAFEEDHLLCAVRNVLIAVGEAKAKKIQWEKEVNEVVERDFLQHVDDLTENELRDALTTPRGHRVRHGPLPRQLWR